MEHYSSTSPSNFSVCPNAALSPLSPATTFLNIPALTASVSFVYTIFTIAKDTTNNHTSPPLNPFHKPRFTPTFHADSTLSLKQYKKSLRLESLTKKAHKPPRKPPKKKRCVGSAFLGKSC